MDTTAHTTDTGLGARIGADGRADRAPLLAYFAQHYNTPTTAADYARRLVSGGSSLRDAQATAARYFPAPDAVRYIAPESHRGDTDRAAVVSVSADRDDTAAGAGWSVVVLCADGVAVIADQAPDLGAATDLGADRMRAGQRVVILPGYDAPRFCRADLGA